QQEVRTHFADTPYKTPEEFQEMVLAHIKNNLLISFNNGEQITLGKGIVKLGHETKVIFEIKDIPASIKSAVITNKVFDDINRNQSVLMVFKEGFVKDHFNLNQANDHTITLLVKDNKFVETAQQNANISPSLIIIFLLAFMGLGYLIKKMLELKTKSTVQDD
ncbi:MAG: hypothetical protein ABJI22_10565, partial [Maribacter sp.]